MAAAIARARSGVDEFGTNVEHFWLGDLKLEGDTFHGTIDNKPDLVSNVQYGQRWTVKKSEISDGKYERGGKMYGNYTLRPLLKAMPPKDAQRGFVTKRWGHHTKQGPDLW